MVSELFCRFVSNRLNPDVAVEFFYYTRHRMCIFLCFASRNLSLSLFPDRVRKRHRHKLKQQFRGCFSSTILFLLFRHNQVSWTLVWILWWREKVFYFSLFFLLSILPSVIVDTKGLMHLSPKRSWSINTQSIILNEVRSWKRMDCLIHFLAQLWTFLEACLCRTSVGFRPTRILV